MESISTTSEQVESAPCTVHDSSMSVPSLKTKFPIAAHPEAITQPMGILQALGMDQSRVNSRGHLYRKSFISQKLHTCDRVYSTDILGHHGCVNALAFSKGDERFLSTGIISSIGVQTFFDSNNVLLPLSHLYASYGSSGTVITFLLILRWG